MRVSIIFSFVYILAYCIVINVSTPYLIFFMLLCWPIVMGWVIYTILKDGKEPEKTFDQFFYQDENIRPLG